MVNMLGVGQLVGKMVEGWLVRVHQQVGEMTEGHQVGTGWLVGMMNKGWQVGQVTMGELNIATGSTA